MSWATGQILLNVYKTFDGEGEMSQFSTNQALLYTCLNNSLHTHASAMPV